MTQSIASPVSDVSATDLTEIRNAVADYCEGYYTRNQEQTHRAYHPECLKRVFEETEHGVFYLVVQTRASMVDVANNEESRVDDPSYEITIDEVSQDMASVRLYSNDWVDFLHVVKARGEWKLLHAAYDALPEPGVEPAESDRDAILAAALDYVEAWYQGDAQRHALAYHDECVKRAFRDDGGLAVTSGQHMVDMCATGDTVLPDATWEIEIDDIVGTVASVRVHSTYWVDFLHIAKARGAWRLFHVTYHPTEAWLAHMR